LNEFEEALQGLNQGKMKPNQGLLDQLKELDPENLEQLSEEQLDQLRENMKQHAKNCQQCQGGGEPGAQGQGDGDDWLNDLLNEGPENGGPQEKQPEAFEKRNRGPGSAPGVLGQISPDVNSGDLEGLESTDLSKSLPGDLLELNTGKHEVDRSKVGPRAGGTVEGEAKGGARVWKDSLLPSEKSALKEFFK
ncbi:MAG: hypothetical protein QGH41_13920, partial [Roseibacillus sp.]|nr:hypothetical protein [Roseibacillus sp.]